MLCSIWDFVQTFFIEEVFNQDTGSYFLQARKELKAGASSLSALKGWVDWAVINKLYQGWINEINYKLNCHVFFTCKATRISKEDDPGIQDIYSIFGVKPEGEKRNIYRVHSAFLLSHDREWVRYFLRSRTGAGSIGKRAAYSGTEFCHQVSAISGGMGKTMILISPSEPWCFIRHWRPQ